MKPTRYPTGVKVRTPTGRLASVMHYDEDGRVHVRYIGSDREHANEQGVMPAKLIRHLRPGDPAK